MATTAAKPDHLERTATEPRDKSLNTVVLKKIDEVNDKIRLFRLEIPKAAPIRFLPGQWLDVFVPGIEEAGGFTITSSPGDARCSTPEAPPGYLELAVQKSPDNPPAAWMWQDSASIVDSELHVRVGGGFVWPPPGINVRSLRKVVFVAGGVGINPLMSMFSSLASKGDCPFDVQFLYSMKDPGEPRNPEKMLFLERLASIFGEGKVKGKLQLFLTGGSGSESESEGGTKWVVTCNAGDIPFDGRRITADDVAAAAGDASERRFAVVYVCGVPTMTDEFVQKFTDRPDRGGLGMEPHRVLCEKWW